MLFFHNSCSMATKTHAGAPPKTTHPNPLPVGNDLNTHCEWPILRSKQCKSTCKSSNSTCITPYQVAHCPYQACKSNCMAREHEKTTCGHSNLRCRPKLIQQLITKLHNIRVNTQNRTINLPCKGSNSTCIISYQVGKRPYQACKGYRLAREYQKATCGHSNLRCRPEHSGNKDLLWYNIRVNTRNRTINLLCKGSISTCITPYQVGQRRYHACKSNCMAREHQKATCGPSNLRC
jgi:hypothetical protein